MLIKEPLQALQILLFYLGIIFGPADAPVPKYQNLPSKLQLETRIISQQYCKNAKGIRDTLHMQLALIFKNTGERPVILYNGAKSISRTMVSVNLEAAAAKNYVQDAFLTVFTSGEPSLKEDESLPNKHFVVIPSGATYKTTISTDAVFSLRKKQEKLLEITLASGDYYLQIEASIWPFSKELAENLKNRWKETGDLYFYNQTSLPMPFKIEKEPKLVNCNSHFKN
jgi:hypothetical protein